VDVYINEIPGGQYTNLYFQALSMGLAEQWEEIKHAYAEANQVLGDIVKVTPSSKVVGDLASFMVTNKLDRKAVEAQAEDLNFPSSVVEFLQGYLGQPHGGFPEPFRSKVLKDKTRIDGRPGKDMRALDFDGRKADLEKKYSVPLRELDVMSSVQFPTVFDDYITHLKQFGNVTNLPTREFLEPMELGEKVSFNTAGKNFEITLDEVKDPNAEGKSVVTLDISGEKVRVEVKAKHPKQPPFIKRKSGATAIVGDQQEVRKKADKSKPGSVGAPLPGKILDVRAKVGQVVKKGDQIVVLSSMKLEITVTAPIDGTISSMNVAKTDMVLAGDLLFQIQ